MVENVDTLLTNDLTTQITALIAQVQENSNRFMALEDKNTTLYGENRTLQE